MQHFLKNFVKICNKFKPTIDWKAIITYKYYKKPMQTEARLYAFMEKWVLSYDAVGIARTLQLA